MKKDLYVSESAISGRGLFTRKPIKKGSVAFILKGKIFSKTNKTKHDSLSHPDWVGIGKNQWIDPAGNFRFINHSCQPNMGIKGKVTFVALRNIQKDEELTFDYSITEEDPQWEMENHEEKTRISRPMIRAITFLPEPLYKKYLPYIPKYFQKVYTKSKYARENTKK